MKKKIINFLLFVAVICFFLYIGVVEYGRTRSRLELISLKKEEIRLNIKLIELKDEEFTESKSPNGEWKKNLEVIM